VATRRLRGGAWLTVHYPRSTWRDVVVFDGPGWYRVIESTTGGLPRAHRRGGGRRLGDNASFAATAIGNVVVAEVSRLSEKVML